MRNRSSSKGMGEKEEQPHLSGAYIRSLVKQLSHSSRSAKGAADACSTMTSSNPHQNPNDRTKKATHQDSPGDEISNATTPTLPHKKQVRRRLHTTRPYQERLLNMAEARREIVTALKIHRASMKQAKEKQQQMQLQVQQLQAPTLTPLPNLLEPAYTHGEYPLNYSNISNYLYNANNPPSFSWPWSTHHEPIITPITPVFDHTFDNLDLPLPSQPLGLNLNFQDFNFNTINNSSYSNTDLITNNPIIPNSHPSPTTSSNNSHSCSSVTPPNYQSAPQPLHPAMDEEEMAAICSIGEKHEIEWNDTVNLVTSAWWSKFLRTLEGGELGEGGNAIEGVESCKGLNYGFDEALNAPMCEEQLFGYYQADADPMEGADLPQLDIGELEGWDGEWLS